MTSLENYGKNRHKCAIKVLASLYICYEDIRPAKEAAHLYFTNGFFSSLAFPMVKSASRYLWLQKDLYWKKTDNIININILKKI